MQSRNALSAWRDHLAASTSCGYDPVLRTTFPCGVLVCLGDQEMRNAFLVTTKPLAVLDPEGTLLYEPSVASGQMSPTMMEVQQLMNAAANRPMYSRIYKYQTRHGNELYAPHEAIRQLNVTAWPIEGALQTRFAPVTNLIADRGSFVAWRKL